MSNTVFLSVVFIASALLAYTRPQRQAAIVISACLLVCAWVLFRLYRFPEAQGTGADVIIALLGVMTALTAVIATLGAIAGGFLARTACRQCVRTDDTKAVGARMTATAYLRGAYALDTFLALIVPPMFLPPYVALPVIANYRLRRATLPQAERQFLLSPLLFTLLFFAWMVIYMGLGQNAAKDVDLWVKAGATLGTAAFVIFFGYCYAGAAGTLLHFLMKWGLVQRGNEDTRA